MLRELKTFMMFYKKVGFLRLSLMGKPRTPIHSRNPRISKNHNQVLLDLFEDDTNAAFAAVKAQFLILTIF
jgi:hypothetical protein